MTSALTARPPAAALLVALAAAFSAALTPAAALAGSLVATRVIPGRTIISPADVRLDPREMGGALSHAADAIGREARVTLYAGRAIRAADLTAPALVERNALVRLRFARGGIDIVTTGRALGRGALGEGIRVMNLTSRAVVEGRVSGAGEVEVGR